jgi:hypothetical protein
VRDGVAITGDALWGVPAGALRLMPDEKLADPARAALSIRRLLEANVRHLLVGDGMPVFHGAFDALATMLDARRETLVRRANVAELTFDRGFDEDPSPFTGAHRLTNDSSETCLVLLVSNVEDGDACFYPDSQKVLVEATGLIVRSVPEVGYFDGESGS